MIQIRQFLPTCSTCFPKTFIQKWINNRLVRHSNYIKSSRSFSTENHNKDSDFDDGPIKYSTSPASKYRAKMTRTGIEEERLWYEPYVILGSIAIFLIYFCVIREENDIDKELSRSLYSRIEGLEETQLRLSLKYNEEHGMDTTDIRKRLEEIEEEKQGKKLL